MPIANDTENPTNQSKLVVNTCTSSWYKTQENMHKSVLVLILTGWKGGKFFEPNMKPSNAKPSNFHHQMKTAWIRISSEVFPILSSRACGMSEERIQQPDYNAHYPQAFIHDHPCSLAYKTWHTILCSGKNTEKSKKKKKIIQTKCVSWSPHSFAYSCTCTRLTIS